MKVFYASAGNAHWRLLCFHSLLCIPMFCGLIRRVGKSISHIQQRSHHVTVHVLTLYSCILLCFIINEYSRIVFTAR